ncbi:MAG: AAA family ATPase [Candidatus Shapirobacteria bacterium]
MLLVIITGLSCTGKSTIGKQLAEKVGLTLFSRDRIKDILFDHFGVKDRDWSLKVGAAAYSIFYYEIEELLKGGSSAVVETNFNPKYDNAKILELQKKYKFDILQILFKAKGDILFQRFKKRSESGERHPGHCDHLNYEKFRSSLLMGRCEPLDVGGELVKVDTTEFSEVNLSQLEDSIRRHLKTDQE